MTPLSRSFKSGRKVLIRTYLDISRQTGNDKCIVYDEKESMLGLDALDAERDIVPLVQIEGIRFTSRSFEVDLKLVQVMALDKRPDLSEVCLIKMDSVGKSTARDPPAPRVVMGSGEAASGSQPLDTVPPPENVCASPAPSLFSPAVTVDSDKVIEAPVQAVTDTIEAPAHRMMPIEEEDGGTEEESQVETSASAMPTVEEVNLDLSSSGESMVLKKPDEVYYEIYRTARAKAKRMRQAAVEAYLEARSIKSKYLLNDMDSSDEEEDMVDPGEGSAI